MLLRRCALALGLGLAAAPSLCRATASCAFDARPGTLLKFRGLAGGPPVEAAALAGKVVLVVNTASYCGYTPQLSALQALHERFSPRGLVVLGVPCNDFGAQEPDEEHAIRRTYEAAPHGVRFPLAGKHSVTGGAAHPFYLHMQHRLGDAGSPHWNFRASLAGALLLQPARRARRLAVGARACRAPAPSPPPPFACPSP